jgi:hypothetical protein
VAVLINKALIEIPPQLKDKSPVNPEAQQKLKVNQWKGTQGLAEDVRYTVSGCGVRQKSELGIFIRKQSFHQLREAV